MPKASPPRPTVSTEIRVQGVTLWTVYDPVEKTHSVTCDLCGDSVGAGPHVNSTRIDKHRNGRDCYKLQRAQALQSGLPVPPLPSTARDATEPDRPCFGAPYAWPVGSLWDTYPFHAHNNNRIGWSPFTFDTAANTIYLRADNCDEKFSSPATSCRPCERIVNSGPFRLMEHRASQPRTHRYVHMNRRQLESVTRRLAAEKKVLQSQVRAARKSQRRWRNRAQDLEHLMLLLSKRDVPRLRWVLRTAIKRGTSPSRMLSLLIRAADGTYRARGYSQRELDVACLAAEIGGPRLLYALGRSHGLLSKRTTRRHMHIPRILPSIGVPSKFDIDTNMSAFLSTDVSPKPLPLDPVVTQSLPGHVMMADGIAIEPRAGYCMRQNHVTGLSRETSGTVDTEVSSVAKVEAIRSALVDQRVRFGSEATVLAVAPYANREHYTPTPLVVSPSDKSEDADALSGWLRTALSCWRTHPNGEILRGPIWALATDGDATYRKAKQLICTEGELSTSSPLWAELGTLRGFNRRTSADGQTTWTCDPKHIFKRFATLLRSAQGIMFYGTNIRPKDILFQLTTLGGLSDKDAVQLLDPADKQNVPKAVKLAQYLDNIASDPSAADADLAPSQALKRIRINCFSRILGFFIRPFIEPTMSLSEQLESLSAFSHAVAIIQLRHGSSCFTGALYADTQATIKNIFFIRGFGICPSHVGMKNRNHLSSAVWHISSGQNFAHK